VSQLLLQSQLRLLGSPYDKMTNNDVTECDLDITQQLQATGNLMQTPAHVLAFASRQSDRHAKRAPLTVAVWWRLCRAVRTVADMLYRRKAGCVCVQPNTLAVMLRCGAGLDKAGPCC
jgi:hypothetical protein